MNLDTLLKSLKAEGWSIQKKHLAFDGDSGEMCQGVRVFVCRNGKNYLTFHAGIEQAVNVQFMQVQQTLPPVTQCKTIQEALDLMKKPQEQKNGGEK